MYFDMHYIQYSRKVMKYDGRVFLPRWNDNALVLTFLPIAVRVSSEFYSMIFKNGFSLLQQFLLFYISLCQIIGST